MTAPREASSRPALFKLERYDATPLALAEPDDVELLEAALDEMSRILQGQQWLLGGGVAVSLALGGYYRRHSDLDLVIEKRHLSAIHAQMANHGYGLYTRKLMKHRAFGVCIYVRVHPRGRLLAYHPRRLCFVRPGLSRENPYLDKMDVYLYEETQNQYLAMDRELGIEKRESIAGPLLHTRSGHPVRCLNLYYVRKFSERRGGPRHLLDVLAIDGGLERAKNMIGREKTMPQMSASPGDDRGSE